MKYFVVSDIHGEFNALIKSLKESGFEENNKNHTLISLGDNFDRGDLNLAVFNYLNKLERKILIKGNHELILEDVIKKGYLDYIDIQNGTAKTISSFSRCSKTQAINDCSNIYKLRNSFIQNFLKEKMVRFFETENYIFIHGFIPIKDNEFNFDLNNMTEEEFIKSTWSNTESCIDNFVDKYANGYFKTIAFGHWHSRRLNERYLGKVDDFSIFNYEKYKLIGIDSCANYTKNINVLIIED